MKSFLKTLLFLIAGTAFAQPYPSKPIRVIVPFSPGGPVDVVMRLLSPKMTEMLGQPLVIENKTGAGGNLGVQQVARAPADGYTVLATSSSFAVNPALTPDAGYNPEKDFIAVAVVASQPNFIVVNAAFPARTLAELLDGGHRADAAPQVRQAARARGVVEQAARLAPRRADAERARLSRHGGLHLGRAVPARRDTHSDCAEAERRGDPGGAKRRHPRAARRAHLRADGGAAARDGRLREERAGEVGQGRSRYRREGRITVRAQKAATASLPSRERSRGCAPHEACPNSPVTLAFPPTRDRVPRPGAHRLWA